jgi:hypothetical protein
MEKIPVKIFNFVIKLRFFAMMRNGMKTER